MAGNAVIGALRVLIGADTAQLDHALKVAGKGVSDFGRHLERESKALDSMGKSLQKIGRTLSVSVTAPITALGAVLFKLASDAAESDNLFNVAMGTSAAAARAFSEEMSRSLGMNAIEMRKTIAIFYQMTTAAGLTSSTALSLSKGLTQLTGDLASFFNLKPEEAFQKLQSAISGEIEPLRRLGVDISETAVKTALLNLGLVGTSDTLTNQQKILGRYLAIIAQTKNAQGDLANTLDSPANRMRILSSRLQEVGTQMGTILLPIFNRFMTQVAGPVVGALDRLVNAFARLSPSVQNSILATTLLAALLGPAALVFGTFTRAVAGVIGPLGTFIALIVSGKFLGALKTLASRFTLLATGAALIAVGIAKATGTFDEFIAKIQELDIFKTLGDKAGSFGKILTDDIVAAFKKLTLEAKATEAGVQKALALAGQMDKEAAGIMAAFATPAQQQQAELDKLNSAFARGIISAEQYGQASAAIAAQVRDQWGTGLAAVAGGFAQLTGAFGKESKTMAAIAKAAAIVQATISMFTAGAKALELGFPLGLAAAATMLGQGAALVAAIKSTAVAGFAAGGSFTVPGGISARDNVMMPMALASGERVTVDRPERSGGGRTLRVELPSGREFFARYTRELVETLAQAQRDGYSISVAR